MLPTPDRLRRNHFWSAIGALALTLGAGFVAWSSAGTALTRGIWLTVCLLGGMGLYRCWTARWRRRVALQKTAPPAQWDTILTQRVAFYNRLEEDDRERFRRLMQIFLDEKPVTFVHGEGDDADEVRALVAASAVIPVFRLPGWEYDMLDEVLVYDRSFDSDFDPHDEVEEANTLGLVATSGLPNGLMILSRPDLLRGYEVHGDRQNVGLHEFAHLLDKATGQVDGVPSALPPARFAPWVELVRRELAHDPDTPSDIPAYGYTSEEEFFAVAVEYFFEDPDHLAEKHPELYTHLEEIFRQNPRRTFAGLKQRLFRPLRREVGRNSPCPCGSGRKYKKCCGRRRH